MAQKDGRASKHLVIAVHGIRTFGDWQDRLAALLKTSEGAIEVRTYKYGYFSALAFALPFVRFIEVRRFRAALRSLLGTSHWDRVDIVAHSFGTHIVAWGLHGMKAEARPRVHTLILAGSVLRTGFPWEGLIGRCIARVVNECGTRDAILILSQMIPLTGMAGRVGFYGMTGERLVNRYHRFGHSDYFLEAGKPSDDFMRSEWLPLLTRSEPVRSIDARGPLTALRGFTTFLINNSEPIKLAFVVGLLLVPVAYYRHLYVDATLRLVDSLIAQGDTLVAAKRMDAARASYLEARRNLQTLDVDQSAANFALYHAYWTLPPALQTGEQAASVRHLAVSMNGEVAVTSDGKSLQGWDLLTGLQTGSVQGCGGGEVTAIALAGAGVVVAGMKSGEALACGLGNGRRLWAVRGLSGPVTRLASSWEGTAIALGDAHGRIRVLDSATGKVRRDRVVHKGEVTSVAFSADSTRLISAGSDGAYLWTLGADRQPIALEPRERAADVAFAGQGRVAIAAGEGVIRFWDSSTRRLLGSVQLPERGGRPVLSPDGQHVLAAIRKPLMASVFAQERFDTLDVLFLDLRADARTPQIDDLLSWKLPGYATGVRAAAIALASRTIVFARTNGGLETWNLDRRQEPRNLRLGAPFQRPAFSRDGLMLLASEEGSAGIWDAATLRRLQTFSSAGHKVASVAALPAMDVVATGGSTGEIKLWDTVSGQELATLKEHAGPVVGLLTSPDGGQLLSIGADGSAYVWSVAERTRAQQISGGDFRVADAAYSPDSRNVALASTDGTLWWWDARRGERVSAGRKGSVFSLAFSSRGSALFSSGRDGVIRTWRSPSAEPAELGRLGGQSGIAFLREGWIALAGGGPERAIAIWDVANRKPLYRFPALPEGHAVIAVAPDNARVVTAGAYGQNLMWNFAAGSTLQSFEGALKRARAKLREDPRDKESLATLGRWFAFRGRCDWASRMFESAGESAADGLDRFRCFAETGRRALARAELGRLAADTAVSSIYVSLWTRALARAGEDGSR